MEKLRAIEDFKALEKELPRPDGKDRRTIVIPAGTCSQASGANDLIRVAKRELLNRSLAGKIALRITGCHGFCQMEPNVLIEPEGIFYPRVTMDNMMRIVEAVYRGEVLEDLLFTDPRTGEPIEKAKDIPFFARQARTILSQNEKVDPIRIVTYIAQGGYTALSEVLAKWKPAEVVEAIRESGLRGRGGAGFPTGRKWEMLASQPNGRGKFLVCNADEGDPGAYMDRAVLEGNPQSIIEGMLIGAFATGATDGIVYVRNEYPLAIRNLGTALRQARELGLLGERILGTDFSFDIKIVRGAGAFVCGEETALIRSIEGRMGEPRQRPPFPINKGIEGKPTAINNVETWSNISVILRQGARQFRAVGTGGSAGTKIFSLVGKIRNTGLVEVPMGMTIAEIIEKIGGGPEKDVPIKAVQTGGPSGGCIPARRFDLPIDYDSLVEAGSIMGSGGMIVMDDHTCMVDVVKYFMNFLSDESCGKCFVCRKGTQRMWELLDDISRGKGTVAHLELLEELARVVRDASMCGLGQSAANPVLSTLKYFRDEYLDHIESKRCPARVCKDLVGAPCQSGCPLGTEAWRYVAAIERRDFEEAYRVIRASNPFPSVCARVCHHPCESQCRGGAHGGKAIGIRILKRFVTDRVHPPQSAKKPRTEAKRAPKVAVIGAGPSGLVAAHYLARQDLGVTLFESEKELGGMLVSAIPEYRLPREVLQREIEALLDPGIEVHCGVTLGRDFTLDRLFEEGYKAVYLAMGAHKSRKLNLPNEDLAGVISSMAFLKAFNLDGRSLAKGRVAVVGGGNSALDAARVAVRQPDVTSVTILYRRTRDETPAYPDEIEAALEEGIQIETLVTPVRLEGAQGRVAAVECLSNRLGDFDSRGRRLPVPVPGSEHLRYCDTLIVAIGEEPETAMLASGGIELSSNRAVRADSRLLTTSRPGVFAGGDVVSGPDTVVQAIAAGKKAAEVIGRFVRGEALAHPATAGLPSAQVPESEVRGEPAEGAPPEPPKLAAKARERNFHEVEQPLGEEEAVREARRCLRCDLEFSRPGARADGGQCVQGGGR